MPIPGHWRFLLHWFRHIVSSFCNCLIVQSRNTYFVIASLRISPQLRRQTFSFYILHTFCSKVILYLQLLHTLCIRAKTRKQQGDNTNNKSPDSLSKAAPVFESQERVHPFSQRQSFRQCCAQAPRADSPDEVRFVSGRCACMISQLTHTATNAHCNCLLGNA